MRQFAFLLSVGLHAGFVYLAFAGQLPNEGGGEPPVEVVEVVSLSVEEFEELYQPPEAPAIPPPPPSAQAPPPPEPQAEPEPEPAAEQPAFIPPPPPPDPEVDPLLVEQLTDNTPQPETETDEAIVSDAPYAVAPQAPPDLESQVVTDASPREELRQALPQPKTFATTNQNPLAIPGPRMPRLRTADAAPRADTPDIPPAPEPEIAYERETEPEEQPAPPSETVEPEPRVAAAPTPRRRPARVAVAPKEQPAQEQPQQVASAKPKDNLEEMLNNLQLPPSASQSQNTQGVARRYVGGGNGPARAGQRSLWLNPFEISGLQSDLNRCVPKADTGGYTREQLIVVVRANFTPEGKIVDVQLLEPRGQLSLKQRSVLRFVTNKLLNCPPFILPQNKYDDWDVVDLVIDPVSGQIAVQ